jgi:hypothetical protein
MQDEVFPLNLALKYVRSSYFANEAPNRTTPNRITLNQTMRSKTMA